MAISYRTSLKTTRMQAVRDDIDSGAGPATLEICSASYAAVLVTFTLNDPASTVTGDTLTLAALPLTATAGNSGTAAVARIKESGGTVVVNGLTVGTSATDITISSTTITSGVPYNLNSGTIVHAA